MRETKNVLLLPTSYGTHSFSARGQQQLGMSLSESDSDDNSMLSVPPSSTAGSPPTDPKLRRRMSGRSLVSVEGFISGL